MPFTPAHPAAILPLIRLGLPASALAIGSMAPDFPYFLLPGRFPHFGHTLAGIGYFCVPAGLVALAVFHAFLRAPALALLPGDARARLAAVPGFRLARPADLMRILLALAIGALTHLLWDSFTHSKGAAVLRWAFLQQPVVGPVALYKLLQHGGTLIGFALIALAIARWYRQTPPIHPAPPGYSSAARRRTVGAILAATAIVAPAYGFWQSDGIASRFITQVAVGATLTLIAAWIVLVVSHRRFPPSPARYERCGEGGQGDR